MEQITRDEMIGLVETLDAALILLGEDEDSEHRVRARSAIAALQAAEPVITVDIRRDPRDGSPAPRILKFADLGDGEHQLFALPCPPAKEALPELTKEMAQAFWEEYLKEDWSLGRAFKAMMTASAQKEDQLYGHEVEGCGEYSPPAKSCDHCNNTGEMETDNNGPIVPCPLCQASKAQVPEGWKLVPVKPTKEMRAACKIAGKLPVWDDMLAAAPAPPADFLLTASPAPNNDKDGCTCQGCGVVYSADLIVPDNWWEKIKPEGKAEGAGLLCPTCIMDRLVEKGWSAGHIASPAPDHATDASKLVEALEKIEAYEIKSSPTATDFGVSFDRARWIGGMKEIARAALAECRQQEEAER